MNALNALTAKAEVLPLLRAEALHVAYASGWWPARRRTQVLQGVDLTLHPGETVGLVGENGSGKSTLVRCLVGLQSPDEGGITTAGLIGYCPQAPVVYGRLTCDEHLDLFARAYGLSAQQDDAAREQLYEELGFTAHRHVRADRLSGGTLAKLNLAIALLPDPPVLLLDEPYAGFDWDTYLRFWQILARRRTQGAAVLVVSHFVSDQERFDRVLTLHDGKLTPR